MGLLHADTALHIGDAIGAQGMAAQIRKTTAVIVAARLLQFFKHADKTLRGKTGLACYTKAGAVSLPFHVA